MLGEDLKRVYSHADVFHCEPLQKVAYDFIERRNISEGSYNVAARAKYALPDCWDIGEVFERLIEDCYEKETVLTGIQEVYSSWLTDEILNFNSDLYYQSRE